MKHFILLIIFVLSCSPIYSDTLSLFKKGNELYQKGKFQEAIPVYEQIVTMSMESPELYYNLGNAYYKTGNIANSILNYERALRLAPEEEDVQFNLKMAHLKVVDKITPKPALSVEQWWRGFTGLLSVDTWSILLVIINFLLMASIATFIYSRSSFFKKLGFTLMVVTLTALVIDYFAAKRSYNEAASVKYAIIFSPASYVKSSPDEKSTDLFILHEGTKAKLLDEIGPWYQIEIADGNKGWLKKETLRVI